MEYPIQNHGQGQAVFALHVRISALWRVGYRMILLYDDDPSPSRSSRSRVQMRKRGAGRGVGGIADTDSAALSVLHHEPPGSVI